MGRPALRDYVAQMNDRDGKIPAKLKTALNRFFAAHVVDGDAWLAEGCIVRVNFDNVPVVLIIESSPLYDCLQGAYGWDIHTDFHNAFDNTGYHMEMINSCQVGFYKD